MWKYYYDFLYEVSKRVGKRLEEELGEKYLCDSIDKPWWLKYSGLRCHLPYGVGVEFGRPKGCRVYLLDVTKEELDYLRDETQMLIDVAEYDKKRYEEGRPFDAEIELPCDEEVLVQVSKAVMEARKKYGERR